MDTRTQNFLVLLLTLTQHFYQLDPSFLLYYVDSRLQGDPSNLNPSNENAVCGIQLQPINNAYSFWVRIYRKTRKLLRRNGWASGVAEHTYVRTTDYRLQPTPGYGALSVLARLYRTGF